MQKNYTIVKGVEITPESKDKYMVPKYAISIIPIRFKCA